MTELFRNVENFEFPYSRNTIDEIHKQTYCNELLDTDTVLLCSQNGKTKGKKKNKVLLYTFEGIQFRKKENDPRRKV